MDYIRQEADRARAALAVATDPVAKAGLEGVIFALDWAYDNSRYNAPTPLAAALVGEAVEEAKPVKRKARK
ncbi:MAG: hypothetical protein V4696_13440 [Pseudomonadota bacterium]